MSAPNLSFWPEGLPYHLPVPQTSLWYNLEVSATRYPDRPAVVFYDSVLTYSELRRSAEYLAGHLQYRCGVSRGDRVALFMANSPQFIIAFYAILRADAMVVPVNSMNTAGELAHVVADAGASVLIVSEDLLPNALQLAPSLRHVVTACYSDYLTARTDLTVPELFTRPRQQLDPSSIGFSELTGWSDALDARITPRPHLATADDLCVLPYTSGTTGTPKGCVHRHRSVMHTTVGLARWHGRSSQESVLCVLPMFHVTGMQACMNSAVYLADTLVLLPRWDRDVAAKLISRYRVTNWTSVPTLIVDLLSSPDFDAYDLSSLRRIGGGGAAMPRAVAEKLHSRCSLTYIEGYGLTETMAPSHINPPARPKRQCLGLPIFDTDSRVVEPGTLQQLPVGEVGEIVTAGPQVFEGYWNNPAATAECFIEIEGRPFLRTGDLGYVDEDGYFFFVDRLKRMVNAAGFKVWPAEVEAQLYSHPSIQEVVVIAKPDARRGETVKALVVLRAGESGRVTPEQLSQWARERMAAYKVPREWEFVASLPKSATGKIQWRLLQEQEKQRFAAGADGEDG